jgi:hypothetical protein
MKLDPKALFEYSKDNATNYTVYGGRDIVKETSLERHQNH